MATESERQKIEKIALFACSAHSAAGSAARRLKRDLQDGGIQVVEKQEDFDPAAVDLVVLLGGDGFLMESFRNLHFPSTPIFGVNFGSVGYLMNPQVVMENLVSLIRKGEFRIEEHPVLQARIQLMDGKEEVLLAVNDFIMDRTGGQTVRLRIQVGGILLNEFSGDGVIVATSAGSTAYNLAAGGPVFPPGIPAMVITPLYPHRAAPFHSLQFSVLIPLNTELEVIGVDIDKRPIRLVADGSTLEGASRIRVSDSGLRLHLLRVKSHEYISNLSRKFIGRD
jgi:NAD+ kinase